MRDILKCLLVAACLGAAFLPDAAAKRIKPSDPRLAWIGRVSLANPEKAVFTYPGVQVLADFTGTSIGVDTKPGSGYFMVEIDDMPPFKVHSSGTEYNLTLADNLEPGDHFLTLTYVNEGLVMKPEIYGLTIDDDADLIGYPELTDRKIEFIGNSITCGLGNEGDPDARKFDYSMQNQYYTYEAIACRELDAQCFVVARSGIGIYRNNNGNPNGDRGVMPDVYPYTQFGTSGERWDFSRFTPDVVCVNLGTNDTTNPRYDKTLLTNAYKKFLQTLRKNYPKAKIVLLTGTMLKGQRLEDVKQAHRDAIADARRRGDNEVYTFDFTPDDGSCGRGVFSHPGRGRHEKMAQELVPFLREITGWQD